MNIQDQVIEKIDKEIKSERSTLDFWTRNCLEKIAKLEKVKKLLPFLPEAVLGLDWEVEDYPPMGVDVALDFNGGDEEYASLFDAGFDFPAKPKFNEHSQTFYREGQLKVHDPTQQKLLTFRVKVGNITKPPSCKIIEKKKRKTVITFEAVCEESGETL